MLYRWCFSCGHQSMEALWLEFRETTFYHYNLLISWETTMHLCNKCCFTKLSSYCAFAWVIIHIMLHTDYLLSIFHRSLQWKKAALTFFIIHSFPVSLFLRGKSWLFVCMCTKYQDFTYIRCLTMHMHSPVRFLFMLCLFSEIWAATIWLGREGKCCLIPEHPLGTTLRAMTAGSVQCESH